jgi:2-aminoadipate transaminase
VPAAQTIVGNGSQQILHFAAQVLCDPGDIVLVEQPTYFVFLDILAGLGVRPEILPEQPDGTLDHAGIAVRLAEIRRRGEAVRLKAVYLQGFFANPTGRARTEAEKSSLAGVLREAGFVVPVIEDAAYRELWFDHPWPARSVLALDAWQDFPRLYLGTLTKPFSSGLRVGFGHATDPAWFERLAWMKGHADFGTANFNQAILERVVTEGLLDAHLARVRPAYRQKARRLEGALTDAGLRDLGWDWASPDGGLTMWVRGPEGLNTDGGGPLWEAAMAENVLYVPGGLCLAAPLAAGCVRLSFGVLSLEDLDEAAQRFTRAAARAGRIPVG